MNRHRSILRAARSAASALHCQLRDLRGLTLGEVFASAERAGARVFWRLWTDADLQTVIGGAR